jgi:hypothetical protein
VFPDQRTVLQDAEVVSTRKLLTGFDRSYAALMHDGSAGATGVWTDKHEAGSEAGAQAQDNCRGRAEVTRQQS